MTEQSKRIQHAYFTITLFLTGISILSNGLILSGGTVDSANVLLSVMLWLLWTSVICLHIYESEDKKKVTIYWSLFLLIVVVILTLKLIISINGFEGIWLLNFFVTLFEIPFLGISEYFEMGIFERNTLIISILQYLITLAICAAIGKSTGKQTTGNI